MAKPLSKGELLAWRDFPHWMVASVRNDRDRNTQHRQEVPKVKRKPPPIETDGE